MEGPDKGWWTPYVKEIEDTKGSVPVVSVL